MQRRDRQRSISSPVPQPSTLRSLRFQATSGRFLAPVVATALIAVLLLADGPPGGSLGGPTLGSAVPSAGHLGPAASSAADSSLSGWWKLPAIGPLPGNRTDAEMAFDSEDGYVLLFGGCASYASFGSCRSPLDDTWTYRNGTWTNVTPALSPAGTASGMMADDPADGYVVLFGGTTASGTTNVTWTWSGGQWTELAPVSSPPALSSAAMAYDAGTSDLVLFGGVAPGTLSALADTWVYRGGDWTNVTAPIHPPGWISPFLAPNPANGQLLLFGGVSALFFPTYTAQTWAFRNDVWTNVSSSSGATAPGSRAWAIGGFDPTLNETLMYGGGAGTTINGDLWAYSAAGTWARVTSAVGPPGAFYQTAGAWDAVDGYLVDFGRESMGSFYGIPTIQAVYSETWALTSRIVLSLNDTSGPAVAGNNVTFDSNVTGGLGPYTYDWSFGDGTNATGPAVAHIFARAGAFNVTLNATDAVGQSARYSLLLNVTARPTASGGGWLSGPTGLYLLLGAAAAVVIAVAVYAGSRRRRTPPATPATPAASANAIPPAPDGAGTPPAASA